MTISEYNKKSDNYEVTGTKVLKIVFVAISCYLLFQNLFGNPPDLLAFYRSLFLLSASVLFDGMDDWDLMRKAKKDGFKCSRWNTFCIWIEFALSLVCFGIPIVAFFTRPEVVWLYNHVNKGEHNWLAVVFFSCYLVCFFMNIYLNSLKPPVYIPKSLKFEKRRKKQK